MEKIRKNKLVELINDTVLIDYASLNIYKLNKKEKEVWGKFNNIEENSFYHSDDAIITDFLEKNILVPNSFNEYEILHRKRKEYKEHLKKKDIRYSYLRISLTENCNLRCKYCFVQSIYNEANNLSEKNFITILEWGIKNSFGKTLTVHYFGGEPILRMNLIELGHKLLVEAKANGKILDFREEIVTNGTLINTKVANKLCEMNIDVIFSIDGWKDINDKNRVYKNGKGSYAEILKGIDNFKKSNPYKKVNLILTPVESEILSIFPEIIKYLINEINPASITVNAPQPYEKGWKLDGKLYAQAIIKSWDICENNNIEFLTPANSYIYTLKNKKPQYLTCMLNMRNEAGIYFSSQGVVSPCVVEMPKCAVPLSEFIEKDKKFFTSWHCDEDSQKCEKCKYINICSGECSVERTLMGERKNIEKCKFTQEIITWILTRCQNE